MHIDAFTIPWTDIDFYCFPPFSCILRVIKKVIQDQARGILVLPDWPTQPWYPHAKHHLRTSPSCPEISSQVVDNAITTTTATSFSQDSRPSYMSCIRQKLQVRGFSPETIKIIESSWRSGTKSQYQSVARKWFEFCNLHNCDLCYCSSFYCLRFPI